MDQRSGLGSRERVPSAAVVQRQAAYSSPGRRTLVEQTYERAPAASVQLRPAEAPLPYLSLARPGTDANVQMAPGQQGTGNVGTDAESVHAAATHGISGSSGSLPHFAAIQASFGPHDVSGIQAHTDAKAAEGAQAMGAEAYATGSHVAFRTSSPSLHTAAHEAAHIVQQRGGVQLKGGVGQAGDAYEQHADAVAERVVRGESAVELLGGQGAASEASPAPAKNAACEECGGAPAGTGDCPACKATQSRQVQKVSSPTPRAPVVQLQCDPSVASCPFEDPEASSSSSSSEPNASYPNASSPEPSMSGGPNASTAGTQTSAPRYPNQTCPNEVLDALQAAMHAACDIGQSTCNPAKVSQKRLDRLSCDEVAQRLSRNRACLEARRAIQNTCFGGVPDEAHRLQIEAAERSVQHCEALLQRCRQRQQEREQPRTVPTLDQVLNVLAVLGLSLALAAAIIAALADPEPASKVALAVGSAALALMILQRLGIEPEEGFEA